jgi:hypothetical protein
MSMIDVVNILFFACLIILGWEALKLCLGWLVERMAQRSHEAWMRANDRGFGED